MATHRHFYLFKHVKHGTQNIQNDFHQWLSGSFRAYKIRFRPGLRPGPRWGSLQRSPRGPDYLTGLRGVEGGRRERGKGRGKEGKGQRREEKGKERKRICIAPIVSISTTKRSDVDHTELPANIPHLPFLRISIR